MKITKSELKKLIVEELSSDPELLRSINKLTKSIENLDVSIDYLSAYVTGDDPLSLGALQKSLGRFIKPRRSQDQKELSEGHGGEGSMARSQLGRTVEIAAMLQDMIQDESDLEEWVESKITKAQDYLSSVLNYMRGEQLSEQELDEKIKKVKGGYKATTKSGRELSKKPKSKEDALKQLGAVEASKAERGES